MRALALAILASLLPLLAVTLLLGAYLNYASVRAAYVELTGERFETVSRRIANEAHTALMLGLPLAGQVGLERTMEREMSADPAIGALRVAALDGRVLFESGTVAGEGFEDSNETLRSAIIISAFGTVEGQVMAIADPQRVYAALAPLAPRVISTALIAGLAGALVLIVLVSLGVRGAVSRLLGPETAEGRVPPETAAILADIAREQDAIAAQMARPPGHEARAT
ncbi:hypothetical protein RDV64_00865 [Acuticoccus sp. MNP-M23]|uniref:hypothetical protein n=1 Tax=Acuticoccus sp. MNP-M23 TaxID=3072793 RepID=UPI002814D69C|nr:hypothetical protein [Acuticoccus sp. MNP-M23]WMS42984.1 hypothetical protein RDV64_00865 [Acuticoccus sp. MNP-M23]